MEKYKSRLGEFKQVDSSSNRSLFNFPKLNGKEALYFSGNSLGLQPKSTKSFIQKELDHWATYGVEGHFTGDNQWLSYHKPVSDKTAPLVGAKNEEVVVMNSLTANLHFLLCGFFQPKGKKKKILIEANAFPSDIYAVKSQLRLHGLSETEDLIIVQPTADLYFDQQYVVDQIKANKDELALVLIGGMQYLSGQLFNLKEIAKTCQENDVICGFDLAHAVGNVPLKLNEWGVDFAAWCSYKYLNSGPGGVAGAFVHEKHHQRKDLTRLEGWWSNKESNRFLMQENIDPYQTAEAWQVSNAPVLSMAAYDASISIFQENPIEKLREKSLRLTAFLEEILSEFKEDLKILTPKNKEERGCQLSVYFPKKEKNFTEELREEGVIADFRHMPEGGGLLRFAPTPLYNTFEDIVSLGEILKQTL